MKLLHLFILTSICICLCSCHPASIKKSEIYPDAEAFSFSDFKEIAELKSEELDLDTLDIVPLDIEVINNVLISRNKADEKLFTIVDLDKKSIISNHINIGQGPEDMLYPSFAGYDEEYMYICDQQTSKINVYRLNDMLSDQNLYSIKQIKLDKRIINKVSLLKDGFVGSVFQPYMKYIFNKEGKTIDSIPYPSIGEELTAMENFDTFQNHTVSNGKDKIAVSYFGTDVIDFYNLKGELLKRLHGPEQFISLLEEITLKNGAISSQYVGKVYDAYSHPKDINNQLWVLYCGMNNQASEYEYLLTFSWEGKPLKAYHLDIGIRCYAVDTNKRIIYAVTEQPDTRLITFAY